MPKAIIITRDGMAHQRTWGEAFAHGLRRHGWEFEVHSSLESRRGVDLVAMWGVRREKDIAQAKAIGAEVCVLERGYIIDRFQYSSVSFGGGLNGRGEFSPCMDAGARWRSWDSQWGGLLKPWRPVQPGGLALIMGQIASDQSVKGVNVDAWYIEAQCAMQALGLRTRVRPHPGGGRITPERQRSLADDLALASVVVTYNSNSGVDAVLAGVPTIACDQGSMAWPVAGNSLAEIPPTPDRTAWAHELAWRQWTLDEMRRGRCWEAIGRELVPA